MEINYSSIILASPFTSVCLNNSGHLLASGHGNANIQLWDVRRIKALQNFAPHNFTIPSVRYVKLTTQAKKKQTKNKKKKQQKKQPKQRSCLIQADSTFRQIQTRFNIFSSFVMGFIAAFMEKMIVELSHKDS